MSPEELKTVETLLNDFVPGNTEEALEVMKLRLMCAIVENLQQVASTLETVSNSLEFLSEPARKEIEQ